MSNDATSSKKVVLNSAIYSLSGLLLRCFSFFLLPLYTAYLTTNDYGITSIANSFSSTMMYVISFSLFSAVMRFYVDLKSDHEKLKRFYGTIIIFVLISGIAWGILFTIFRDAVSKYIFSGIDFYPVVLVCLIELVFSCSTQVFDTILKSQQRAATSSIITMANFFCRLVLNILFVVVYEMGAIGVILASTIVHSLNTLAYIIYFIKIDQIHLCLDFGLLKSALKYSIPIMPHNLSTKISLLVSKALIGGTASLASLGVYSVATQFGDIADTIQGYVDNAYEPWLFEKLKEKEDKYKETIRNIVKVIISILGLFFISIALLSQDYILLFVNDSYYEAWKMIPLIVLNYSIKTIYYFYIAVLFYNKKASKLIFTATLTGSIVNVILSSILIPIYSAYGSILADAIAMLIRVSIIVFLSKKFDDVGLKISDFVINFIIIALFIAIGFLPSIFNNINSFSVPNLIYKIAIIAIYALFLFIRYRTQLKDILGMAKKIRKK